MPLPSAAAAIRALHYASVMLPVGVFVFRLLLLPARAADTPQDSVLARFERQLALIFWLALGLALISGFCWLASEAADMSGSAGAVAFEPSLLGTVLRRTQFGRIWLLRLALLLLLAGSEIFRRRSGAARIRGDRVGALLAGMLVGALASAGHAAASEPAVRVWHLAADFIHLFAAAAWLGGLLPLALLIAVAWRSRDAAWRRLAATVVPVFGDLGLVAVGMLVLSGLVNAWILVGDQGGLFGTGYGRLLLLKLAIFAVMLALAAINRLRLTGRLSGRPDPASAVSLYRLGCNAALEFTLGLLVLLLVGQLGATAPAVHTSAVWPFPFRVTTDAMADEDFPLALFAGLGLIASFAVLASGLAWRRRSTLWHSRLTIGGGLFGLALAGMLYLLVLPAYPTSYRQSPIPYQAASITRGAPLYAENCMPCHGREGYGDGPAAAALPIKPANLTAGHLLHHAPGDLFWWISNGIPETPMPGFAAVLTASERWDVLNFLRARADADLARSLTASVEPWQPLVAPDFTFELAGSGQETLKGQRGRAAVLLVLYALPAAAERLQQLAAAETRLRRAGIRLLLVPLGTATAPPAAPVIGAGAKAIAAAYGLFRAAPEKHDAIVDLEFLIDRQGYLRARWSAGDKAGWAEPATLLRQANILAHEPARAEAPEGHVH